LAELAATREAEFAEGAGDVELHRIEADPEASRDRGIAHPMPDSLDNPPLRGGEHIGMAWPAAR
jgi:hypothetical protein